MKIHGATGLATGLLIEIAQEVTLPERHRLLASAIVDDAAHRADRMTKLARPSDRDVAAALVTRGALRVLRAMAHDQSLSWKTRENAAHELRKVAALAEIELDVELKPMQFCA